MCRELKKDVKSRLNIDNSNHKNAVICRKGTNAIPIIKIVMPTFLYSNLYILINLLISSCFFFTNAGNNLYRIIDSIPRSAIAINENIFPNKPSYPKNSIGSSHKNVLRTKIASTESNKYDVIA